MIAHLERDAESGKFFGTTTTVERFWSYVEKSPGCWTWRGGRFASGYGQFRDGAKKVKAHRFSYAILIGGVPVGLQLDHVCKNKACVNPAHLEPVTGVENVRRSHGSIGTDPEYCRHGHPRNEANAYKWTNRKSGRQYIGCAPCRAAARERSR